MTRYTFSEHGRTTNVVDVYERRIIAKCDDMADAARIVGLLNGEQDAAKCECGSALARVIGGGIDAALCPVCDAERLSELEMES